MYLELHNPAKANLVLNQTTSVRLTVIWVHLCREITGAGMDKLEESIPVQMHELRLSQIPILRYFCYSKTRVCILLSLNI